ncbi:MAG TPA: Swt1 family HEPN domain-containing protein [Frateuria sp.]|uniref:Swt1 family HEPN domain-containing protein n=1 Tax=Frateuria sp. TaxID=2211372 RepID=UPI002D7F20F0|nr:Swt1 family HEPN domain-containing protein [Frateuria sp.]HET6805070.1 Swt1 family HEPN domain-containing protein [Frateuria sp.]
MSDDDQSSEAKGPRSLMLSSVLSSDALAKLRMHASIGSQFRELALGQSEGLRQAYVALQYPVIGDSIAQIRALLNENPIGSLMREMQAAQEHMRAIPTLRLDQFRTPMSHEIGSMLSKLQRNPVAEWLRVDQLRFQSNLSETLAAIRQPYLNIGKEISSFTAAVELQSIGLAVREGLSFNESFAHTLRADLGDWRDDTEEPADPIDVESRAGLYADRGLQPELVAFPVLTFSSLLEQAGLILPAVAGVAQAVASEEPLELTKAAYAWLLHFEHAIRHFINQAMTRAVGPRWIQQRVSAELIEKWKAKQEAALAASMARPSLLDYADFMDYPQIITRKDNWREVFKPVFLREEHVRESFHRLKPVRNATMHAGLITQQDLLFLCVEIHRLTSAMRS